MYEYKIGNLVVQAEPIQEGISTADDPSWSDRVPFVSKYIVHLENTKSKAKFDVSIEMEGTPGAAYAASQVLCHIRHCLIYPLDLIARADLSDPKTLLMRLTEVRQCVMIGITLGVKYLSKAIQDVPEWDLTDASYGLLDVEDHTNYDEYNEDS